MNDSTLDGKSLDASSATDTAQTGNASDETSAIIEPSVSKETMRTDMVAKRASSHNVMGWILGAAIFTLAACNYVRIGELRDRRGTRSGPTSAGATDAKLASLSRQLDGLQSSLAQLQRSFSPSGDAGTPEVSSGQFADLSDRLEQLQQSVDCLFENESDEAEPVAPFSTDKAIETARQLEEAGEHERAGYYWRNAIEHASDSQLFPVLKEYAESVFKVTTSDDVRFTEAATLERLAELALVRVSADEMDEAFTLRDQCVAFREKIAATAIGEDEESEMVVDEAETAEETQVIATIVDSVEKLLNELESAVKVYNGNSSTNSASEAECKILQLSGVAENAMSQLWFLDRTGLDKGETNRIDGFPKRLADIIDAFNERHDRPILNAIRILATDKPPKQETAPHQRNIEFFTDKMGEVAKASRHLRGTEARLNAQEAVADFAKRISDEKRQQMNEYQKFVANCCKLAFDSWDDAINTGSEGYGRIREGRVYGGKKITGVTDFINRYVRDYSRKVPVASLAHQTDRRAIYNQDSLLPDALRRDTSHSRHVIDVNQSEKAFIVTAIFGLYRVDQSLLTPETARIFNDTYGKYLECMEKEKMRPKSVRWMVEEPKIRLEDF